MRMVPVGWDTSDAFICYRFSGILCMTSLPSSPPASPHKPHFLASAILYTLAKGMKEDALSNLVFNNAIFPCLRSPMNMSALVIFAISKNVTLSMGGERN